MPVHHFPEFRRILSWTVAGLSMMLLPTGSAMGDDSYYHSLFGVHALTRSGTRIAVQFDSSLTEVDLAALIQRNECLDPNLAPEPYGRGFVLFSINRSCSYEDAAAALGQDGLARRVSPVYLTSDSGGDNDFLRVTDEVIVAFDRSLPADSALAILRAHELSVVDANPHNPNQFLCTIADTSKADAISRGNEMHDLLDVRWACANFTSQTVSLAVPSDNYYPSQFYAQQIQADLAWDVSIPNADTVKVAVIDDGVAAHLDLPSSRIAPGWDVAGPSVKYNPPLHDNDPTPGASRAHGMKVTGVLAASLNDTGIVGVNPWCKIAPFKIWYDDGSPVSNYWRALAIDSAANSGSIAISCSWTVQPGTPTAELQEAIIRAEDTTETRRYGCVLVFGAGNTYDTVNFPANMPQVIAVGAVGSGDYHCPYSCTGAALDLVAPSDCQFDHCIAHLITTDQMGSLGINPVDPDCDYDYDIPDNNYTQRFCGTSAACPQVAAVASLLLARRSDLVRISPGWGQASTADTIKTILYKSANDLGDSRRDNYYGWGRVNAYRALLSVIRGDVNNDGVYDIDDIMMLIDIVFSGGQAVLDNRTADVNCDWVPDVFDVYYLIDYIFSGGPRPVTCFSY